MNPIPCFFIEPTGRLRIWLRRFRSTPGADDKKCPLKYGYHHVMALVGDEVEERTPEGYIKSIPVTRYEGDPRWPVKCDCGYEFNRLDEADQFQVFRRSIYRRVDTGAEMLLDEAPPGAIWDAWWYGDRLPDSYATGADGKCLVCKMPGGHDWMMDGRAGNCDSPCKNCGAPYHAHKGEGCNSYEDARPHKCWIRHGTVPNLTVDKNGVTCNAGAGSIIVPGWHGFLRNGHLEIC